jgi:hypothetical protein
LVLSLVGCAGPTGSAPEGRPPLLIGQQLPQPGSWTLAGYHRYRGWLGKEPITLELTFSPGFLGQGLECTGRYYYERHGGAIELLGQRVVAPEDSAQLPVFRSEQPLFLRTWGDCPEQWQAVQVAGPLLHGLWTSRFDFIRQYFELREDYHDAIRYEIKEAAAYTICTPYDEATGVSYSDTSYVTRDYLHLLGPDTLRPEMRRLQCPGPAQRQAQLQALARDATNECAEMSEGLQVLFNGFGLLTLSSYASEIQHLQPHPNHTRQTRAFDLQTGRELLLSDLLDLGAELPLRQVLARKVIQELGRTPSSISRDKSGIQVAPLPEGGVGVLSDGLLFAYGDDELVGYAGGMPVVIIPYTELLPLLRPNSPLRPLLRARGLRLQS